MAEKKQHTIVAAAAKPEGEVTIHEAKPVGNAKGKRVAAVILWIVAFAFEVLAGLVLLGKINLKFMPTLYQLIAFLVLDLICVIIGSQCWKKANHIQPASKKNKVKFWLWNNMGVIVCIICFLPIIILFLTNKDLDKKTKAIAIVVAVIALLIGGLCSYDFDPISSEELSAAEGVLGDESVYWTPFGKVYHTHEDCSALNHTDTLTVGTVDQAVAANRTRLCSFCARTDEISAETGMIIDGD